MTSDVHAVMRDYIRTLSSRAWESLRHSQNLQPPFIDERGLRLGRPRLQLWRDASGFHDGEPHTLTVFQPFNPIAAPLLRKGVWKRSEDQRPLYEFYEQRTRAELPEPWPTFDVQDKAIDRSAFEALLDEALRLRIPVAWPWQADRDELTSDVGMEGFEYFDLAEPQASVRCAWSVALPPEWQPAFGSEDGDVVSATNLSDNDLRPDVESGCSPGCRKDSHSVTTTVAKRHEHDSELRRIIDRWPRLSTSVRVALLAIVDAVALN